MIFFVLADSDYSLTSCPAEPEEDLSCGLTRVHRAIDAQRQLWEERLKNSLVYLFIYIYI